MANYPESLDNDPDGVSTALEVGATFWLRGDYADAVKWLRKAVDAAFDEGADERGLELSKVAALLATTVPTTPAPPPPSSLPEPVEPAPMPSKPPPPAVVEQAAEVIPPPTVPLVSMRPTISSSGLPLARTSARASEAVSEPKPASATSTIQGTGEAREPAMLTPFAMPRRVPTPRAVEAVAKTEPTAQEVNERTPTRPLDEPSVEELVHSAFPEPPEAPKPRVRTRVWNSTDALRVAVSREGEKTVLRMFDGTDLAEGEIEAVLVGLSGGPELAEMLRVFGDE